MDKTIKRVKNGRGTAEEISGGKCEELVSKALSGNKASIKSLKAFETQLIRFKSITMNNKHSNELSVKVSNEIHIYISQNKKNDYCNIIVMKEALKKNKLFISVEE